ncbi:MAG: hypothetical protein R3Y63_15740 [Eubacteriales bacterium]
MNCHTCCHKCEERKLYCHSTCEKYLAEKEISARIKEKQRQEQDFLTYTSERVAQLEKRNDVVRIMRKRRANA